MSRRQSAESIASLLDAARGLSGDFDKLSQAVSEKTGLSSAELLAMDLIARDGPVTAGRLARELTLTTGAITGLIDRLERAGLAERTSDPTDRRRVLVKATARERHIRELYGPLAQGLSRIVEGYSVRDRRTLLDFVQKMRALLADTAESIQRPVSRRRLTRS
jgi:DNA-binding MarR family transcriptional regulator